MARERATIIDVARAAGVSPSTVSLVLRGGATISSATIDRVRLAIDELHYVYNRGAASLRQSRSKILGVVIHDLANTVFSELAVGVDAASQTGGYVQFMASSGDDPIRQANLMTTMREYGVSGLIVSPATGSTAADFTPLTDAGIPIVLVGRTIGPSSLSSVVSDNRTGAAAAVDHLVALGHRRIVFIGGRRGTDTFATRVAGFREAMARHGLEAAPDAVVDEPPSREGGRTGLARVRDGAVRPTAVVAFNDEVAIGVLIAMRAAGLTPGADLSVVGFDDVPEASATYPPLTSVAIGPQALGRTAGGLLIDLVEERSQQQQLVVPVELHVRGTTGPPPR